VATLGGSGLAVSRQSAHPEQAIDLVRFLIRSQVQMDEKQESAYRSQPEKRDLPALSESLDRSDTSTLLKSAVVSRPSSVTGSAYEQVARAYIAAVHSVLAGQKAAPEAAAELEKQLIKITGFKTGPPRPVD